MNPWLSLLASSVFGVAFSSQAEHFNIRDFGASPNDATDDTKAVAAAFAACGTNGGGKVFIPAGTYMVSRQGVESPILELPSNSIITGEGSASVLKFDPRVNDSNFWRMLGISGARSNIVVRDLRLDGSTTATKYDKGKTPEHNHGVFLYSKTGTIENITFENCLVENFSGDCIAMGYGCRNITVRNVRLRNFIRQGIQMGGGNSARDYLVTGCQDLEPSVKPGGSTIHVEHARGLTGVTITGNHCRNSILAGGVTGMIIRDNMVTGRIVGNNNTNLVLSGNVIRGKPDSNASLIQQGYADGLIIDGNILSSPSETATGIYVWGTSRYNAAPSQNVSVTRNLIRVSTKAVYLNGVKGGLIRDNTIPAGNSEKMILIQRSENIEQ